MMDLQAHARKLRADAAECQVLSNLVTEERRNLFARIAEHLNSLASEIESGATTKVAGEPAAVVNKSEPAVVDKQATVVRALASQADHLKSLLSRNKLPGLLLLSAIVIAGSLFWATNLLPKAEPLRATRDEANRQLAASLSEERGERKAIRDQLSALITRLDGLARELDDLKSFRSLSVPSNKSAAGQADKSPASGANPPAAGDKSLALGANPPAAEEKSTPSPERPAAPERIDAASPATASPTGEQLDQVGAIAPTRAELKPPIGPAGCTRFRSFDPVSGTYMTFDGRRRQCR